MRTMLIVFAAAAMLAAWTGPAAGAQAVQGEATAAIRETTDKILAIVKDPELQKPGMEAEKRARIRKIADERFAWADMARRSLGRNWTKLSEAQRQEFVPLFTELIYGAYMDKVTDYKGEKIVYNGEQTEEGYSTVNVTIITEKNVDVPVRYRMTQNGGKWLIYDVSIEGVSLVNNYRTQFGDFLTRGAPEQLIAKLKQRNGEGAADVKPAGQ
jgi:phospholipid transport system substrate-binding protein